VSSPTCDQNCARCLRALLPAEPRALTRDLATATGYDAADVVCPGCLRVLYRERDERTLDREVGL
jgi:hypothetical protein